MFLLSDRQTRCLLRYKDNLCSNSFTHSHLALTSCPKSRRLDLQRQGFDNECGCKDNRRKVGAQNCYTMRRNSQELKLGEVVANAGRRRNLHATPQPLLELLVCVVQGSAAASPNTQACLFGGRGLGLSSVCSYSATSLQANFLGIFLNFFQFTA